MTRQRALRHWALVCVAIVAPSTTAQASPGVGLRQTVEVTYTTTKPNTPTGFTYTASFRNPANPSADPPSLRRLMIGAHPGTRIDSTLPPRCVVSDAELKEKGEGACPPATLLGRGSATIKATLLPAVSYRTVLFNAPEDQLELLTGDPPAPPAVVHGYLRNEVVDSPIPTCLNGGYVPQDCPNDQVTLLGNTLTAGAYTAQRDGRLQGYLTTPPVCPPSGRWRSPVTFMYGDGAVETVVTEQPCTQPAARRGRLSVSLRPPTSRAARTIRSLKVAVRAVDLNRARGIRVAVRRVAASGKPGRVLGRLRRPVTVRGRRVLTIGLRQRGLTRGRHEVAVRSRDAKRVARRFSIR